MEDNVNLKSHPYNAAANANRVGYYAAMLTAIMTFITFSFAMIAIPISGANCPGDCAAYPYMDTISQYPRDFIWMYLAIIMLLVYVILMVAVHFYASQEKKIFSMIGLTFAIISVVVLLGDYFTQVSVIPVSLMNAETEGLPLLIQYNSHGVFIALEELGYLMMSLSFLFMAPVFDNQNRLQSVVRGIFRIDFVLSVVSLIVISILYGLERLDRFEVIIITLNWLTLIVNGILLSIVFKRRLKAGRVSN